MKPTWHPMSAEKLTAFLKNTQTQNETLIGQRELSQAAYQGLLGWLEKSEDRSSTGKTDAPCCAGCHGH